MRIPITIAGVIGVALLAVTVASAKSKPPHPHGNGGKVPCAGQAALVAAINAANSAGGGTLTLAHRCDYQLTSADNGENGLPVVTTAITVNGNQATIDGTSSVRIFEVDAPGSLSLRKLTITGGSAADFGGGIANFGGTLMLDQTRVTANSAGVAGGGIASATFDLSSVPAVTIRHSFVTNNQQTVAASDGGGGGGGIVNVDGTLSLDHTRVNGNTAQGGVGGGIASGDYFELGGSPVLKVEHSQVNKNVAPNAGGGGIQNLLGSATIGHSQINGNTALNGGGISSGNQGGPGTAELRLSHSEVDGNTATAGPGGEGPPIAAAGIANGSDAVIRHSRVDNNVAPNGIGAGIVNHAVMTISHSRVNRNTAAAKGPAGSGGGIFNAQGPPGATPAAMLTIEYSKVNHNTAGGFGGGIANGFAQDQMSIPGGDLKLTHSQVNGNTAAHGGGIFNNLGTVTLTATEVTGNQVDNCEPTDTIAGCTG